MAEAPAPIAAQIEAAQPLHNPMGFAPPQPAPMPAPAPMPVAAPVAAPAPVPHKPLVDETDWRVSRPAARPAVRATEPIARPLAARPVAAESRAPNLFQRITGAFATPKAATPAVAAPMPMPTPVASPAAVEPTPTRTAPENVIAVTPKPAPRPAPVQTSISLDVTERTKPARDDDDLQIPAFLRRQAN